MEGFRKRVFDIDVEHCPHCGGKLKIIAAIEEPGVIAKILAHLGLPTSHLRYAPALRNPAPLGYRPKPSLAWAFAARSQLTPASLAVQPSHPGLSFAA